ncbi:MAG: hypothetical protein ACP5R4_07265 [Armatimonadota bacterium]
MAELVDLDVREISLVDCPATGRRFRIRKRRQEGELGLRSLLKRLVPKVGDRGGEAEPRTDAELVEISKAVQALAEALEKAFERIEKLESGGPTRQSAVVEPADGFKPSIWKGVL